MTNEEWQRQKLLEEAAAPEPARYRDEQDPAVARIMGRVEADLKECIEDQDSRRVMARVEELAKDAEEFRGLADQLAEDRLNLGYAYEALKKDRDNLRRVALEVAGEIEALTRYGPPDELTAEIAATAARLRDAAGEAE